MTALKENALTLLGSASINGQTTGSKQTVYTVPSGKTMIVDSLVIRTPSATLAGLTDMDVGGDASASDWIQQVSLDSYTGTTDTGKLTQPEQAAGPPIVPTKKAEYAAATAFGVYINTGSTGAATFTIDLYGYLF